MLIKLSDELIGSSEIRLKKDLAGEDATLCGAFSDDQTVRFALTVPRVYGACGVIMRLWRDGEPYRELPLFCDNGEVYHLTLSMDALSRETPDVPGGLFYYYFVLLRGEDSLFCGTEDQVHCALFRQPENPFRLLIHDRNFSTPDWFKGGVMYQIFVDRFYKSGKVTVQRQDAEYTDWEHDITQYGAYPGAPVKNNEFFGGDLWGVAEKLEYLASLGVTVLYLCPIFRAYSNHKYDTGDYLEIDPSFGGREALDAILQKAEAMGIRVILDGVFNHTGDNSRYFNRYGAYPDKGAWQNSDSPYRNWYRFGETDEDYDSWWGIKILPKLNHENPECRQFFTGESGVGAHYAAAGIGGWRLDVADELSDSFLDEFCASVKKVNPKALIIGEVWENAADKIAYGIRRRYLRGGQLDSVMNYPFRNGILAFLQNHDGEALARTLTEIYASYPKCVCNCLMNLIGTHDTERILSVLADRNHLDRDNKFLAGHRMDEEARKQGIPLLQIASAIQFTVYGVPSVYYGDEAGMEGGHDPFCRRPFPWGKEVPELLEHYRRLGEIRKLPVFEKGAFRVLDAGRGYIRYQRAIPGQSVQVAANLTDNPMKIDCRGTELLTGKRFGGIVPPGQVVIVKRNTSR